MTSTRPSDSSPRPLTGPALRRRTLLGLAAAGTAAAGIAPSFLRPDAAHAAGGPTDDSGDADFSLTWEETFDGSRLDPATWEYELGNIRGNEQQHYSSSTDNVRIEDGRLVLAVTDRPAADQYRNTERLGSAARLVKYNSGSVRTHAGRDFLYGRLEIRARLPKGKGAFPAIWTLGHDFPIDGRIDPSQGYGWPSTGEIDIAEMIGAPTAERAAQGETASAGTSNRTVYGTPHFWYSEGDADGDGTYAPYALGGNTTTAEDLHEDFHVFGVNRTPDKLEWLLDGVVYKTLHFVSEDPADQARRDAARAGLARPAYLQINLATGGNWAGDAGDHLAEDGTRFEVDWVRFSQTKEQAAQDAAYRSSMPALSGVADVAIRQGDHADLVAGVTTDSKDHAVEVSVNDSPLFVNTGAPGGRNEVHLRVASADDADAVAALPEGTYAMYLTAVPRGEALSGGRVPTELTRRRKATLTVLPAEGVEGDSRGTVATVDLPEGYSFRDPSLRFSRNDEYVVDFVNPEDPIPARKRPVHPFVLQESAITLRPCSPAHGDPHPRKGTKKGRGRHHR